MPGQFIPIVSVEKDRYTVVHGDANAAPVTGTTLRTTGNWPCTDELSGVNAIVTQLRDPIYSGMIQWRMVVKINKGTPPRKSGGIP